MCVETAKVVASILVLPYKLQVLIFKFLQMIGMECKVKNGSDIAFLFLLEMLLIAWSGEAIDLLQTLKGQYLQYAW